MSRTNDYTKYIITQLINYFGSASEPYQNNELHCYDQNDWMNASVQPSDVRYQYLFELLDNRVMILTLHLAVAQYECMEIGTMIQELTGRGVCMSLALDMLMKSENILDNNEEWMHEIEYARMNFIKLQRILLVENEQKNNLYTEVFGDERLIQYLNGLNTISSEYKGIIELYTGQKNLELYGYQKELQFLSTEFCKICEQEENQYIQITASDGGGKRTLVKKAADQAGISVVFVNMFRLENLPKSEKSVFINEIIREIVLYDAGVCIINADAQDLGKIDEMLYLVERYFNNITRLMIVTTTNDTEIIPHTQLPFIKLELPDRKLEHRIEVWKGYAQHYHTQIDSQYYGTKCTLSAGQVGKIFYTLYREKAFDSEMNELERKINEISMNVISMPEKGSLIRTNNTYCLEDLRLPLAQKESMMSICSYMKDYYKVYYDWNLKDKFPYGRGMTALFVGTPGTGKTMAAGCISSEIGLPLYKVDLSQIVDKYIGETEKKLEAVFRYAQSANVVLFFDEADALFAKRSEVKDSKDKYANTEVSYILQRIEQYDGMVILASNFMNNIDEAFMRRMKYVIEFHMPDALIRKEIWETGFTEDIPRKDIDFEFLSEKFELSGGHIKNIILNAAFLAAKKDECVTMKHILLSVQNEYRKLGKKYSSDDFGDYSYCLYQ